MAKADYFAKLIQYSQCLHFGFLVSTNILIPCSWGIDYEVFGLELRREGLVNVEGQEQSLIN